MTRRFSNRRCRGAVRRSGKFRLRFELWFLMLLVVYIGIVLALVGPRWRNPPRRPSTTITRSDRIFPNGHVQRTYTLSFSTGARETYVTDTALTPTWQAFRWTHAKERSVDAMSSEPWPNGATPTMRSTYVELEKMFLPAALKALEQSGEAKVEGTSYGPYSDQSHDNIITITWEPGSDTVDDLRAVHQRTGRPN